jgi:HK97 family phage prohead protease
MKSIVPILRTRDAAADTKFRHYEIREEDANVENGMITMTASTNDRVGFGGYGEILDHDARNVDISTCRALLLNHQSGNIVGRITGIKMENGRSSVTAEIFSDAKLATGVPVRAAVKAGALRGVSIGYNYDDSDCDFNDDTRTITVRKWRLLEVSLTPIPRDSAGTVRSLPAHFTRSAAPNPRQEITMDPIALAKLFKTYAARMEFIEQRIAAKVADFATLEREVIAHDTAEKAREAAAVLAQDEATRARQMAADRQRDQLKLQIIKVADSHGLRGLDYTEEAELLAGGTIDLALARMLTDKAKGVQLQRTGSASGVPKIGVATIENAAEDKFREAAIDGLLARSNPTCRREDGTVGMYDQVHKDKGMRLEAGLTNIARHCLTKVGNNGWRMSKEDVAQWILDTPRISRVDTMQSRAANEAYGQFPGLMSNYLDKVVAMGFQSTEDVTYNIWATPRICLDFKPFIGTALSVGNLQQTTENVAFPELTAADMNYTGTLGLFGATITLTYQLLTSDDLGEWYRCLGMSGAVAQRTRDRLMYVWLMAGPGTNGVYGASTGWNQASLSGLDYVTGVALGTVGNLDTVRDNFRKKITPAGQYLGIGPKYLIHPISLSQAADRATGRAQSPGEPNYLASNKARQIQCVEVNYIDDSSISGYSALAYYLIGPQSMDTMKFATLEGMQTPQVLEFDPGATAARNWKIMDAFIPVFPAYTDSNGILNRPLGITKGTG